MSEPSADELLLINCLLYSNDFEDGEGDTIAKWANDLRNSPARMDALFPPPTDPTKDPGDVIGPGEMTRSEFERVLDTTISNPDFSSMKIKDVDVRPGSPFSPDKSGDELVMTTIDFNGTPIVVFKGTGGDVQWRNNGDGGYYDVTDTREQQYALNYFNSAMENYPGQQAYVSGHSTGANAAQYVTVIAGDKITDCYSFDGQGFDPAFYAKYADQVSSNGEKIHGISNHSDFVGILFDSMASMDELDNDHYTGDGTLYGWNAHSLRRFHSPFTIFAPGDEGLRINPDDMSSTPTGPYGSMTIANDLVSYLEAFMPKEDFDYLCWMAMGFLIESGYAGEYGEPVQMPKSFTADLLMYIKGYADYRGVDPQDVLKVVTGSIYSYWVQPGGDDPYAAWKVVGSGLAGSFAAASWASIPSVSYSVAPREFTQEVLDHLLALVAENYSPIQSSDWSILKLASRLGHWLRGNVDFGSDSFDRDAYYRDMIDLNNTSAQKFRKIWDDVAAKDSEFASQVQGYTSTVEDIDRMANNFADNIRTF